MNDRLIAEKEVRQAEPRNLWFHPSLLLDALPSLSNRRGANLSAVRYSFL